MQKQSMEKIHNIKTKPNMTTFNFNVEYVFETMFLVSIGSLKQSKVNGADNEFSITVAYLMVLIISHVNSLNELLLKRCL